MTTSLQRVNIGNYANDGTGDDLLTAFTKINANFAELETEAAISTAVNLGNGVGVFAQKRAINLEFKSLASGDNSVVFTPNSTQIDLKAVTLLSSDLNPVLGADLDLNNHKIYGGDVQTSMFGINVQLLNAVVQVLVESGSVDLDLGSITVPTGKQGVLPGQLPNGYELDFGLLNYAPPANELNFGTF